MKYNKNTCWNYKKKIVNIDDFVNIKMKHERQLQVFKGTGEILEAK